MSIATTAQPTKLYHALLLALRDMGPIRKTATNPGFRSKYADLPSILDTVDEPLHAHGLLVVQRLTLDAGGPVLLTELIHAESGETLTSAVAVVSKDPNDPQKFGSALTYYRRYSLLSLLGLAPEDDDGNAASQPARTPAPSYAAPQPRYATEPPPQVQSPQPPAASTAQATLPAAATIPTEVDPFVADLTATAWSLVEDGKAIPTVWRVFSERRKELDDAQWTQVTQEWQRLKAALTERDAATAQPGKPASYAG